MTGAVPVVENNDGTVFTALLKTLLVRLAASRNDFLLLGMHESDPLHELIVKQAAATYVTRIYHVCWDDGEEVRVRLDKRPAYLELGCL